MVGKEAHVGKEETHAFSLAICECAMRLAGNKNEKKKTSDVA
jgi:hypothetical protein